MATLIAKSLSSNRGRAVSGHPGPESRCADRHRRHSTPAVLKSHSWHPVPTMLWSRTCLPDGATSSGERACARGSLGVFPATDELPLALGYALRLIKYGA